MKIDYPSKPTYYWDIDPQMSPENEAFAKEVDEQATEKTQQAIEQLKTVLLQLR